MLVIDDLMLYMDSVGIASVCTSDPIDLCRSERRCDLVTDVKGLQLVMCAQGLCQSKG